jgi:hypothetical protein
MRKITTAFFILAAVIAGVKCFAQTDTLCTNLQQINSNSNEYLPFLIDSTLFFTSDRRNTLEGQTLEFTEKVYWSVKKKGTWCDAKKDGYKWNSDNNTALVGVGPKNYFFYRSYWKDNGEVFVAPRKEDSSDVWKAKPLQKFSVICSEMDENSITTCNDDTFYFVSNRNGNYDIFMQNGNSMPVTVDVLNSNSNEQDVFISTNGKKIFFSSDRPGGKGGYDIFASERNGNTWTSPVQLQSKLINTRSDDRDFRWYNDSTMFLSSDRSGGSGGFDIFQVSTRHYDTVKIKKDTIPVVILPDTIKKERDQLVVQLKILGLFPFKGELQIGAYRFVKSVKLFKTIFKCVENEDLRADTQKIDGVIIYKYIINKVYTDIDEALIAQLDIINRNCLPDKDFIDTPFIAILKEDGKRYAIFWKKDEFENHKVFYIYSDGKQIWKGKRF